MLSSSPPRPSSGSRPPQRTYGRRSKRPVHRDDSDSDTETDEDESPTQAGKAAGLSRDGTPTGRSVKRSRTSANGTPTASTMGMPLSRSASSGKLGASGRRNGAGETLSSIVSSRLVSSASSGAGGDGDNTSPIDIDGPIVTVQPPSSVHPSSAPSTPPPRRQLRRVATDIPSPSPKDLSSLFAAVSPRISSSQESIGSAGSSVSVGGTRRARGPRRMLSKAQSMLATASSSAAASVSPPSTPRRLRPSQSMPITPSGTRNGGGSGPGSGAASPNVTHIVPPPSPGSGGHAKRTYGRARTFLAGEGESDSADLDAMPRASYAELRKRYEVDNELGGDGAGNLVDDLMLARAPEPITDMRSRGENRRFMDEIAFLVDGVSEAQGKNLKRMSALDVLERMLDDEWVGKLVSWGQTERVFEVLCAARSDDEVMDAVCLLFLAILSSTPRGLEGVLQGEVGVVIALATANLDVRKGPLDESRKGKVTLAVQKLRNAADKIYDGKGSTRRAASQVLARALRESSWHVAEGAVVEHHVGVRAMAALASEVQPLCSRLELFAKGLDLMPKDGSVEIAHLEHCLEVLSALAIFSPDERDRLASRTEHVLAVVDTFLAASAFALEGDRDSKRKATTCIVIALQLLTPLASSKSVSSSLSPVDTISTRPGAVAVLGSIICAREGIAADLRRDDAMDVDDTEGEGEPPTSRDDHNPDDVLSLVLALLASLVRADTAAAIATTRVSTCGKRACILGCRCASAEPLVSVLAQLYASFGARADEADLGGYLHGYLGFLITQFLLASPEIVRPLIAPHLPGPDWMAQLAALHAVLTELHSVNAIAHRKLRMLDDSTAPDPSADDDDPVRDAMVGLSAMLESGA